MDIRADILGKLQPIVVVHDSPQHPLRLPLMVTAVASADPAQTEGVKTAFGKLMAGVAADLDHKAAASHEVGAEFTHFRLRTDADAKVMWRRFRIGGAGVGVGGE